ncbi:ChaN family lipoprotein [Bacteroidota bacterium]
MKIMSVIIFFLACIMCYNVNAQRQYKIYESATGKEVDVKELTEKTLDNDVIFFGEFHDDSLVHALQAGYLREFYDEEDNTVVSMEMFERDVQVYLDDYLSGEITEEEFLKNSRAWRNYKNDYKPLVELAKENDAYVIAANVPRKYAGLFARGGNTALKMLTPEERAMVAGEINILDDDYQKEFYLTMIGAMGKEKIEDLSPNEANTIHLFYGAQIVKDETMGESIINYINENPDTKVIHFDGNFHSAKGLGTVQKVKARNPDLKIGIISPIYLEKDKELTFREDYKPEGDFVIVLEPKPPKMYENMMGGHMTGNYIVKHDIEITLDTKTHEIKGNDKVKFKSPIINSGSMEVLMDLKIDTLTSPDGDLNYEIKENETIKEIIITPVNNELSTIEIKYSGVVYNQPNERNLKQKHAYSNGMISSAEGEGVYLPAGSFYPYTDNDMADFSVKVTYPDEIDIITSGILESSENEEGIQTKVFKTELPADNLTLVGGKYTSIDSVFDGKTFSLYLLKQNRSAGSFLNSMIEYYKDYTRLFGKYPYSNFSLVENFFATGFGMPGYTLLSGKLLQMPWIVLSPGSLAHEFVHNWWGNSVYINNTSGNWCEALTTFSTNYYYNVLTGKQSKALEWRQKALIAMENLPEKNNYPLEDFKYQKNTDDAVIGYSKGGFFFYELYKLMGEEHFFGAIKNFAEKYAGKRASWFGMTMTFQIYARKNKLDFPLSKIFNQWLKNKDIPSLLIDSVKAEDDVVSFRINQDGDFYMVVPVRITTEKEIIWQNCTISKESNEFSFPVESEVKEVEIDPEYQALRHLNKWEIPYTFSNSLNDNPLVILPTMKSREYNSAKDFIELLNKSGYTAEGKSYDDVTLSDWENRSLIVLGYEDINPFLQELYGKYPEGITLKKNVLSVDGKDYTIDDNILMMNYSHPKNTEKSLTVIGYTALESPEQLRRLFHYMSYPMLLISKTKMGRPLVSKELYPSEPADNPMKWERE